MKIKTIEYENFRNFKEHGEISCSTDGKITVIYGKNGDGKTTLHQLFQWVFYGTVHFNKTTTDQLYNLSFEAEQDYNSTFDVLGRIDFEHDGCEYSLTRKYTYKKGLENSEKIAEDVSLQKMDEDYNWRRVDRPLETIEKMLPSGLSEYFFFDGERMIADLRVKGKDSAGKLRKALYSMFDLDVIESAINHIGRTDLKTTVLGKLYLSKGTITSDSKINAIKTNIENAQQKISDFEELLRSDEEEKKKLQEFIQDISEQIGNTKSKSEYEAQRKNLKRQREQFLNNAKNDQAQFGESVMDMFPKLLISKAVIDAQKKLHLKVSSSKLPEGVSKRLIKYLLLASTKNCVCGEPLTEEHKAHIRSYLDMLPPKSYASLYHDFNRQAAQWGNYYDKEKIETIIKRTFDNLDLAYHCDEQIKQLDNDEKNSKDIESLIIDRKNAEVRIGELDDEIANVTAEKKKFELYLKQQMNQFDSLTKENQNGAAVQNQIDIMNEILEYFTNKLDSATKEYSESLQENIQNLLNCMLTSKRTVSVSREFAVRVTDSFNNESKSEGQFAVVSFAYIGGILKILKDSDELTSKEYPLVLDGPFSKLDPDQRQNVVDALPQFAPQVIVFSKDDLHDVIASENVGRVWTIQSNDEKNVAVVKEGRLWN